MCRQPLVVQYPCSVLGTSDATLISRSRERESLVTSFKASSGDVRNVKAKLGVATRLEAARRARATGFGS